MANCPCVEEVARAQTVGPGGIGVVPPINVEAVHKVSDTGIEMEKTGATNVVTTPGSGSGSGGSGDVLVVHADPDTHMLDKTYNEIRAAALAGKLVCLVSASLMENDGVGPIGYVAMYLSSLAGPIDGQYYAEFGEMSFSSDSPDGVPVQYQSQGGFEES